MPLSAIGLVVDIIGVILIFLFGISPAINKKGTINLIAEQVDEAEKKKATIFIWLSRFGLLLIFLGFIFQLISNLIIQRTLKP